MILPSKENLERLVDNISSKAHLNNLLQIVEKVYDETSDEEVQELSAFLLIEIERSLGEFDELREDKIREDTEE